MLAILTIIYYSGIAACGILGAAKYNYKSKSNKISTLICGYLCGFAGGIIRDVLFLSTFPIAFTSQCAIDIFIALIAAIIYEHTNKKTYTCNTFKGSEINKNFTIDKSRQIVTMATKGNIQ